MAAMDLELKRAFTEMQVNKIETTKKMKMIDYQCDVLKESSKKYEITERGITELDPNTRVYSSIGRMFVLSTVPTTREELKAKQAKCDSLVEQLNEKKSYLSKSLKEQEDHLRELVQQKKDADAS
ncbi:unnamed protein product [Hermetia illucens]|uniref:Prefoldin subunit 1 n=1 Tax=Hermetia illucens TaxID=343691 RepID=A0A7R8URX1_HERIL|nr:prefoldin subunit 1 [Hermetia illucens]CAD7085923.1 unnamed protein product [Hermetia illucens]